MKISVQSLFEDYEENTVPLSRDADAERIWEKENIHASASLYL